MFSVQFSCSVLSDSLGPHGLQHTGFPSHQKLPELSQNRVHRVSDAIQPSHPLSFPSSPAFSLSQHQGLFQWVSSSNQEAKYWSFSFSISPSNEYSGFICFRIDWFDLFAGQGTLKSLLQHYNSKTSVLRCSAFCSPTLTSIHDYWKNRSFATWTFIGTMWQCCSYTNDTQTDLEIVRVWLQTIALKQISQWSKSYEFISFPMHVKLLYTL